VHITSAACAHNWSQVIQGPDAGKLALLKEHNSARRFTEQQALTHQHICNLWSSWYLSYHVIMQVTEGPDAGKLALLDFGLVAEIPAQDRAAMVREPAAAAVAAAAVPVTADISGSARLQLLEQCGTCVCVVAEIPAQDRAVVVREPAAAAAAAAAAEAASSSSQQKQPAVVALRCRLQQLQQPGSVC
jgi:hypothetical protein